MTEIELRFDPHPQNTDACTNASQHLLDSACRRDIDLTRSSEASLSPTNRAAANAMQGIIEFFHGGRTGHEILRDATGTAAINDLRQEQQFLTQLDRLMPKVPRGQTIDASQFDAVFKQDADLLRNAGVLSVTRDQSDHFVLNFKSARSYQTQDATIIRDKTLEFDYSSSGGVAEFNNIKGLHTQTSVDVTVDRLRVSHSPNGNTRMDAEGHWGWIHGSKTIEFGPDGEPIPGN